MSRDNQLKERWEQLVDILSNQFSQGEDLDLDAIIYLIGVQELGKVHREYKKMKIKPNAYCICRLLLEPYGFYELNSSMKTVGRIIVSKRSCQHLNQENNLF
jgi:hypothetical protein